MKNFTISPTLRNDCHLLGKLSTSHLLLHRNATIPWFILVPPVEQTELHELDSVSYRAVMDEVAMVGRFVRNRFDVEKINTAAIGNIVSQLHIHVIGRRHTDPCWPGVVWGNLEQSATYTDSFLAEIRTWATSELGLA